MAVKVHRSRSSRGGPDGTTQLMSDGSVQELLPIFAVGGFDTIPCLECGSLETTCNAADEWRCKACGHGWREV